LIVLIIYCFNPVFSKQINYPTINTLPDTTHKTKLQQGDDDPTPSLKSILKDEFKSYNEVTRVDTAFKLKDGQIMKIKLRHYCTYDGKISLPHQYLRMYHLSKFRTHNPRCSKSPTSNDYACSLQLHEFAFNRDKLSTQY
jgi:hypothetical protein